MGDQIREEDDDMEALNILEGRHCGLWVLARMDGM